MSDDAELLLRYAERRDETAFAELVRRHLGLVYHAALRQCGGDAHRAEDVAQLVFADLARKAAALARRPVLAGWLYTSTRYAAAQAVRAEARRQRREQEAQRMNETLSSSEPPADWEKLRPVIDDVLHTLGEREREAVLLRFFEGRPFAELGARLGVSEDAARMRVERALDKMRGLLARRGVSSTTAALGVALAGQSAAAVPTGLATSVAGAALATAGAGGGTLATMAAFMGMTKLQCGIAAAVAAAGAGAYFAEAKANATLEKELAGLRVETGARVAAVTPPRTPAPAAGPSAELMALQREAADLRDRLQSLAQAGAHAKVEKASVPRAAAPERFNGLFLETNQVDVQPRAVFQVRPLYPAEFRQSGGGGEAMIDFVVDSEGAARNVKIVSATHPAFGDAAAEAVSHWQFAPGQKNGAAVATHMRVPIVFTMAVDAGKLKQPVNLQWF